MSKWYYITAHLWIDYNSDNLSSVLQKGLDLGFVYILNDQKLSVKEAVNYLMAEELSSLRIQFEDSFMDCECTDSDGLLSISFLDFGRGWHKQYQDSTRLDIDLHRYGKLLLDVVSDYRIREFTITYV